MPGDEAWVTGVTGVKRALPGDEAWVTGVTGVKRALPGDEAWVTGVKRALPGDEALVTGVTGVKQQRALPGDGAHTVNEAEEVLWLVQVSSVTTSDEYEVTEIQWCTARV